MTEPALGKRLDRGERVLLADVFDFDRRKGACQCGSRKFWRLRSDAPWICSRCHPPAPHINANAIEVCEVGA